ncbi:MAG: 2,4-diketo-3-deoxy-L-fuconate hydrolase [Paracrocinitomix sp.]|jgi:2-keto-4-pentenoate hydratase/2-oxohepta-3-ene-1,7-dioic acid hydratase in catechol pathway
MKLANVDGRACVVTEQGGFDVAMASAETFSSLVDDLIPRLGELRAWVESEQPALNAALSTAALQDDLVRLGPPVTRPVQVFAIGLNYADHAEETGMDLPEQPMVFTKWTSSLAGPGAVVSLPADTVDWEVELVVVMGQGGRDIAAADAFDHVAGYCVGQDISERRLQMVSSPAQFSLAKSLRNFSPVGPWLTTLDEVSDPMDLAIGCRRDDQVLQQSRTSHLIFDVPTLIEYLSARVELLPGDMIFTGTPDGVGVGRRPRVFIEAGWTITSEIEGLGQMRTAFVDERPQTA